MAVTAQQASISQITQNPYNTVIKWVTDNTFHCVENLALKDTQSLCKKIMIVFASILPLILLIPCAAIRSAWKVLSCKADATPAPLVPSKPPVASPAPVAARSEPQVVPPVRAVVPINPIRINVPFDQSQPEQQTALVMHLQAGIPNLQWEDMQQLTVDNAFEISGQAGPWRENGQFRWTDFVENVLKIEFFYEENRHVAFFRHGYLEVLYCYGDNPRFLIPGIRDGAIVNWERALGIEE